MFWEILQRSKQLEIFRFRPRISYFHHNGHSGSYPTGLPCQNGNSAVVAHIFLKFFRRSRATIWGLAGHSWPAGHRLGTTGLYILAVASPAQKKWRGPNNFSLLVSSKKLQYTCMGHPPPPIYKTLFNGFAQISGGVWTEVGGGSGPTHSPRGDATAYWRTCKCCVTYLLILTYDWWMQIRAGLGHSSMVSSWINTTRIKSIQLHDSTGMAMIWDSILSQHSVWVHSVCEFRCYHARVNHSNVIIVNRGQRSLKYYEVIHECLPSKGVELWTGRACNGPSRAGPGRAWPTL